MQTLGFGFPHGAEWIILILLGLLLFGRKLPGIARSLGQSVVEFKKGIKGVKDDAETSAGQPVQIEQRRDAQAVVTPPLPQKTSPEAAANVENVRPV